MPDALKHSAT